MIGHTKCAAGLAGLINASLALHHKVLPPTIGVETPEPEGRPRRRPVPRQHAGPPLAPRRPRPPPPGGRQRLRLRRHQLPRRPRSLRRRPDAARPPRSATGPPSCSSGGPPIAARLLGDARPARRRRSTPGPGPPSATWPAPSTPRSPPADGPGPTLAIVADLARRPPGQARDGPRGDRRGQARARRPAGHLLRRVARRSPARPVAFLFPGQGSQSLGMLGDLALAFPEVREAFEAFDAALLAAGRPRGRPARLPAARPSTTPAASGAGTP